MKNSYTVKCPQYWNQVNSEDENYVQDNRNAVPK